MDVRVKDGLEDNVREIEVEELEDEYDEDDEDDAEELEKEFAAS